MKPPVRIGSAWQPRPPHKYPSASEPHYVYRCYDAEGRLLYVGCSAKPRDRVAAHRRQAHWGAEIARVRNLVFPNRFEALARERWAIATENPLHNIKGLRLVRDEAIA